jgi:hypothetical protein
VSVVFQSLGLLPIGSKKVRRMVTHEQKIKVSSGHVIVEMPQPIVLPY